MNKKELVLNKVLLIANFFMCFLIFQKLTDSIGLLTKEFIVDKLDKSLFEINVNTKVPSRKICYMIKNDNYPSFSVKKFMELLKKED